MNGLPCCATSRGPGGFDRRLVQSTVLQAVRHLCQVLTGDFKAGLTQLVTNDGVRAVILGTRRSALTSHSHRFDTPPDTGLGVHASLFLIRRSLSSA